MWKTSLFFGHIPKNIYQQNSSKISEEIRVRWMPWTAAKFAFWYILIHFCYHQNVRAFISFCRAVNIAMRNLRRHRENYIENKKYNMAAMMTTKTNSFLAFFLLPYSKANLSNQERCLASGISFHNRED